MLTALAIKEDVGEDEGELADIQFAVEEACPGISKPGESVARFKGAKAATLIGAPLSFTSPAIESGARRFASRPAR